MSKISFEITRVDINKRGNYFILIQLDEIELESGLKRCQKFRTEIDDDTEFPQFLKNYFEFKNVSINNKIIIRMGLFQTNIISEKQEKDSIDSNYLLSHSKLIGSNDFLLNHQVLQLLKSHKWIENNLKLKNPEKFDEESCIIFFRISIKFQTLEMKIFDDNSEIGECYYDPFETNQIIIKEKLANVIILNEDKQFKLTKINKELDRINSNLKLIALDKQFVQSELSSAEKENSRLLKLIAQIENYDEIHIEVELLSDSTQGIAMLEKKYAILLSQKSFQSQIKLELENDYKEINPILTKIKIIKDKIEEISVANKGLQFNIKRQEDLLALVSSYEEQIKKNEKILIKIKDKINRQNKLNQEEIKKVDKNISTNEEIEEKIKFLYAEMKKLEEKKTQMSLYQEIYADKCDEDADDNFKRIIGGGYDNLMNKIVKDSETEYLNLLKENLELLTDEEEKLKEEGNLLNKAQKEMNEGLNLLDPNLILKKNELNILLKSSEEREKVLMEEIKSSNQYYDETIQNLKRQIEFADEFIEKNYKKTKNRNHRKKSDFR